MNLLSQAMSDVSFFKPKIGCSSSITKAWTSQNSKPCTLHNFLTNLYLWAVVICIIHRHFFSTWYGIWFPHIQIVFTSHQEPLIQLMSIRVLERKIVITILKFPWLWKFWLTPTNTISTLPILIKLHDLECVLSCNI